MEIKTLWFDLKEKAVVPYDKTIHPELIAKFLVWSDEAKDSIIILGGPFSPTSEPIYHKDLRELSNMADSSIRELPKIPTGAGDAVSKRVDGWKSTGYDVRTPHWLWHIIKEELGLT